MSSSQSTLDGTPSERAKRHLRSIRERLVNSGLYLGEVDDALLKMVVWKRVERGYRLMMNRSGEEGHGMLFSMTESVFMFDILLELESFEGDVDDVAIFSVVVQVSYDNCWLTPCGYWKGPNQVTQRFEIDFSRRASS
jgi:hypothetical protein